MNASDKSRSHWLAAARRAADAAADVIATGAANRATLMWEEKSPTDFVTAIDVGAERRIREILLGAIPELRVVGEELGPNGDTAHGLVAIVDPLDGTTNFLHGYPAYGVSICIALEGVPQVAVVQDVARGGVFWASQGAGAWHNNRRLSVSTTTLPQRALIGTGFPFKDPSQTERYVSQLAALIPLVSGMRRAGSAALDLCDVGAGRFDGFWELQLASWDLAAGVLIVREAGGRVTDFHGRNVPMAHGPVIASNGVLHDWFLDVLNDASSRGAR